MKSPYAPEPAPFKVTVCGRKLNRPTHICAFFDSAAQEDACVAPYVAEGLDAGDQVFAVREAALLKPYLKRLSAAVGRSFERELASGQLRLRASEETYLAPDGFEADRMIEVLVHVIDESRAAGHARLRTCGDMAWAIEGLRDTDELMEYESRVNLLVHAHECTFMCVYDLNRFGGRAIMDVLSTHPMVVMGDRVLDNPYYVEPRDFLAGLFQRGESKTALQSH
jgi:hypothetical protein